MKVTGPALAALGVVLLALTPAPAAAFEDELEAPHEPHFTGFHGQQFDYRGRPGACFNLLSTPMLQVNAQMGPVLVEGRTYLAACSLQTAEGTTLLVSTDGTSANRLDVQLNGEIITPRSGKPPLRAAGLTLTALPNDSLELLTSEFTIIVQHNGYGGLNLQSVELHAHPPAVNGVLGQTVTPLSPAADWDEDQFIVADIYALDRVHGVFAGPQALAGAPRKAMGLRGHISRIAAGAHHVVASIFTHDAQTQE